MRPPLTTRPLRSALATMAAATLLVGGPAAVTAARADEDQVITSAQAEVTHDGQFNFDDAFRIIEFDDPVVNPGNLAYAHAVGCTGCQAAAISFQIVLAQQAPTQWIPENAAVALNENCDTCDASASAYQFVVGGHPVELTGYGRQQLKRISNQVDALRYSGLTGPEMGARADALADQVTAILQTQLRSTDDDQGDGEKPHVEEHRVKDKGHDDRTETDSTYQVDD
jgi:hypothetical protein